MNFAIDFYRQLLRAECGLDVVGDRELTDAVARARRDAAGDAQVWLATIDRSLEAVSHIDRNAHQSTLLECWLDDLAEILQTGAPVASYGGV